MKKTLKISAFRTILTDFFGFKKPIIRDIEYLDIIFENHALFLLSWRFKRVYSIHIANIRKRYRSKAGALIVKLSPECTSVQITVSNLWRKKKMIVPLTKVTLDEKTAATLIRSIPYIAFTAVDRFEMKLKDLSVQCSIQPVRTKVSGIDANISTIAINNEQLKYNLT